MNDTMMPVAKEAWIDPDIRTLDISETNQFPANGNDGGVYAGCTRS